MKTNSTPGKMEAIAKRHGIETLKVRNSDSLDFHDIAVWQLEAMLSEAYRQGMADGRSQGVAGYSPETVARLSRAARFSEGVS